QANDQFRKSCRELHQGILHSSRFINNQFTIFLRGTYNGKKVCSVDLAVNKASLCHGLGAILYFNFALVDEDNMEAAEYTELVGGNKTGSVLVDPVYSKTPDKLATVSSVPQQVAGRYLFRVDDVVRKGGCSNLTVGTYRLTIYPDIVNSMGNSTVTLNGLCLKPNDQPILYFSENRPAFCVVKNAAIAECKMLQYYQWSVKHVYFQRMPYSNMCTEFRPVFLVPDGLDPYDLELGSMDLWYVKNPPLKRDISWYPGNFTDTNFRRMSTLELSLWGYKEWRDDRVMKFIPTLTKLAVINNVNNNQDPTVLKQTYSLASNQLYPSNWLIPVSEAMTYRFGFLKLASIDPQHNMGEGNYLPCLTSHMRSSWVGLNDAYSTNLDLERFSADKCIEWFEEDGQQWNFIRDTETNSSCPCRLEQANIDLGRYMPHPRCSQRFRTLSCDTFIGAKECFISTNNVEGWVLNFNDIRFRNYVTHYGQVCCYDRDGFLMQTTYQTVVQVPEYPYNPGFPQRAYEFGTYPFTKQFELPTLSNYYHDVLPYFFCCKWAVNHCQFFYWRRPGSGCQEYYAPAVGTVMGSGHFVTYDGVKYTFNEPGTYVLFFMKSPKVLIELRLERYPNRMVDFSSRSINQYELVQPLNASVVTGVALQEGNPEESDKVLVILRKDCRRYRYRTNIFVNDELVYFDTMKIQRFRGVTIYVNGWMEGQSEVYVVLEKSRIGVRIRESYGMEIRRRVLYEESMGLLDVLVSVPPEYKLVKMAPYYAIRHKVPNVSELIGPVYTAAPEILKEYPFYPQYRMSMEQLYQRCMGSPMSSDMCLNMQDMNEIHQTCLNMYVCRYDFLLLKQKILGQEIRKFYDVDNYFPEFVFIRSFPDTSCGAVNIEYPDYLLINPPTGKLYLEGNEIQFECYPTHWIKGTDHYTCYGGQWNKAFLIAIFLCCWVVKRSRRDRTKGQTYKTGE
ncbi:unnamed protein product, partial [Soboliphyme baturini]|uniref:AMOP domain-containing protein n=1 Tax=Soboliphyme baturini TaxID=241478 RepID=A0A183IZ31_9BILA